MDVGLVTNPWYEGMIGESECCQRGRSDDVSGEGRVAHFGAT